MNKKIVLKKVKQLIKNIIIVFQRNNIVPID